MEEIKINGFDSLEDFASYAEYHYLPLLDRLSDKYSSISDDDRRFLAFIHDDLVSFVNNFN